MKTINGSNYMTVKDIKALLSLEPDDALILVIWDEGNKNHE